MASNSSNTKQHYYPMHSSYESSLTTNNTTFVRANPSNFRAIVQQLTGSSTAASSRSSGSAQRGVYSDVSVQQTSAFKLLHDRRQQQYQQNVIRKLEMIKLNNETLNYHGPINGLIRPRGGSEVAMASPVSTLDGLRLGVGSPSPRTDPRSSLSEEEERAVIAEKGFYLHPISPLSGGAFRDYEPQLLPLFPLHSPRDGLD